VPADPELEAVQRPSPPVVLHGDHECYVLAQQGPSSVVARPGEMADLCQNRTSTAATIARNERIAIDG